MCDTHLPQIKGGAMKSGAQQSSNVRNRPATFQCNFCSERFGKIRDLRSHSLRKHTNKQLFLYKICGRVTIQRGKKHRRSPNNGKKKGISSSELSTLRSSEQQRSLATPEGYFQADVGVEQQILHEGSIHADAAESRTTKMTCMRQGSSSAKEGGSSYGNVALSGSSSAVIGDVYHYHSHHYMDTRCDDRHMAPKENIVPNINAARSWLSDAHPASPFETLSTFRPDAYTTLSLSPKLCIYFGREVVMTKVARVDQYTLLFSTLARPKIRLTLSIVMTFKSSFWRHTSLGPAGLKMRGPRGSFDALSPSLVSKIEEYLGNIHHLKQSSHLTVFSNSGCLLTRVGKSAREFVELCRPPVDASPYLQKRTSVVNHWNCPWYRETEISHRPLFGVRHGARTNFFIACLQSRWVLEVRFSPVIRHINAQMYAMETLHCMDGTTGFARFLGVIRDDEDAVTAFLVELPAKGELVRVLNSAIKDGTPVCMQRREKWCRQIVSIVSKLHRISRLVGSLGQSIECGIAIDGEDNAVLYPRFGNTFIHNATTDLGSLPPEYPPASAANCTFDATPESDLYQLGLLLWRIAGNKMVGNRLEFCKNANCTTRADGVCSAPHTNPRGLPMPRDQYPAYMRGIISACRNEDPCERPAAYQLLSRFSSMTYDGKSSDVCIHDGMKDPTRPEEYEELYGSIIRCDKCGTRTTQHYFHCGICCGSNYDLCPSCLSEGTHCSDRSHLLLEIRQGDQEDRYYSNVKETGRREIIVS